MRRRTAAGRQATAEMAELARTRDYARSCQHNSVAEVVVGCARSLRLYGFCVLDHVIPAADVPRVRDEVVHATTAIPQNEKARSLQRQPRFPLRHHSACNAVLFLPQLAEFLAHEAVIGVAREALDEHVRIAQFNTRSIAADRPGEGEGYKSGLRGPGWREWHTDWPHMIHGGSNGEAAAEKHMGSIRKREGQAFPDICCCLSSVWYLTAVDSSSGGTYIVPGSHRDTRNPFGPHDGITRSAPIPGELQISAPAGSLFMQDTRCWHSSPMYHLRQLIRNLVFLQESQMTGIHHMILMQL